VTRLEGSEYGHSLGQSRPLYHLRTTRLHSSYRRQRAGNRPSSTHHRRSRHRRETPG
jgi:hypothetical protein